MNDDSNSDDGEEYSDGDHHCESCGASEWVEQDGKHPAIVCGECGFRPRKVVRDEIRESGAVAVTDGGHRDVERMTVEELREEYDPLGENRDAVSPGGHERQMEIWNELRDRVDVEQPECPECGAQNWGQSPGEPKTCNGCGMPLGLDHADLAEDIQQAFNEILSGDDKKELLTDGGRTTRLFDNRTVEHEGEEKTVYNWVNIKQPAIVRGDNPAVEKFEAEIGAGDSSLTPEYVTEWVAEELRVEFGIDVEEHDIETIDMESEEVTVL